MTPPTFANASILVVDDEPAMRQGLTEVLSAEGYVAEGVASAAAARKRMAQTVFDLVITDLVLEGEDGMDLLTWVKDRSPDTPVIMITGHSDVPSAVGAMQRGAFHYVAKPFQLDEVRMLVRRALESRSLQKQNVALRRELETYHPQEEIVGTSSDIAAVLDLADRIAPTESPVIIYGETGTGKDLLARRIHARSRRADRPFIAVNSASLPDTLLESELFGHAKGAFTGAHAHREGLFQAADGGTLFLDEIADIDLSAQARLLRVLQSGEVRRVGENVSRHVDVRLVAATHRDLQQEVSAKKFREDLYYRVNVVSLTLPPLRDRRGDIPLLAEHFARRASQADRIRFAGFTARALRDLERYAWPGNVRELENAIRRAVILGNGRPIGPDDLPAAVLAGSPAVHSAASTPGEASLEDVERSHIIEVLRSTRGNKSRAAEILGISRPTLRARMARYNIRWEPNG